MKHLIVLDGLDGCGKSTQLAHLNDYLTENHIDYRQISFPDYEQPSSSLVKMYLGGDFGGSPEAVSAYAASSFYAVDRYASYKRFWERDYENGRLILAARYTTSNAIHQMGKLFRSEWDAYLDWLEDYEYRLLGLPRPDLVIFLDMPLEIAQQLLLKRYHGEELKKDIHERDIRYLRRCRESALYAAAKCGWKVISCGANHQPFSEDAISRELITELTKQLDGKND